MSLRALALQKASWYNGFILRGGVRVRIIRLTNEQFEQGYKDGSLGIYYIEPVSKFRFRAYSETGKAYKGSTIGGKVLMIPDDGTPMIGE